MINELRYTELGGLVGQVQMRLRGLESLQNVLQNVVIKCQCLFLTPLGRPPLADQHREYAVWLQVFTAS